MSAPGAIRRYRYVDDPDAQFEESNGQARPMTEDEYKGNEYRACPVHMRTAMGTSRVENGRAWCLCGKEYADVSYADYLAYYGNPERHVFLGLVQETQCPQCGTWKVTDSLWAIDFMDDAPELAAVNVGKWADPTTAAAWVGYAGDCVRDMERQAGSSGADH